MKGPQPVKGRRALCWSYAVTRAVACVQHRCLERLWSGPGVTRIAVVRVAGRFWGRFLRVVVGRVSCVIGAVSLAARSCCRIGRAIW